MRKIPLARRAADFGFISTLVLWTALAVTWTLTGTQRGALMAHLDLWLGHYEFQSVGLNLFAEQESELLRSRYGIHERVLALCIVSQDTVDYATEYNRIAGAAARKKFGHDVLSECRREGLRNGLRDLRLSWVGQRILRSK